MSSPAAREGCNVGASTSAVADEVPPVPKCRDVAAEIEPAEIEPAEIEPAEIEPEATESSLKAKLEQCMKNCRKLTFCKCLKPSDVPRVRVACFDSGQASENARKPPPEKIRKTHYLSSLIPRVQCFWVPTKFLIEETSLFDTPELEVVEQILGVYVKFQKLKCNASTCVKCPDCGVCPHLYNCNCPGYYKYPGTEWCAHLHLIHRLAKGKYKGEMSLYIHTDIRYKLVRHLRAHIMSYKLMEPVEQYEGLFEEVFINSNVLRRYKAMRLRETLDRCRCNPVHICNMCSACLCKFACGCPDYKVDNMACMHIHCLGVRFHKLGIDNLKMSPLTVRHKLTGREDKNLTYIVALEHEMSFYIKPKNIKKQEDPLPDDLHGESCIDSVVKRPVRHAIYSNTNPEKSLDLEKTVHPWWKIYKKSKGKREEDCRVWTFADHTRTCVCGEEIYQYSVCNRCKICPEDYRCSCPLDDAIICRHIHAVHRLRTESPEREEDAENFVRANFFLPAIYAFLPKGHENWPTRFEDDTYPVINLQPTPSMPRRGPAPESPTD